jgi:predicted methyltransferase
MLSFACLALLLTAPACARNDADTAQTQNESDATLKSVIADERRGEDRGRDQFRHPYETIQFFQIEPGMTVVDFIPGSWYAKILVPYLGSEGKYVGAARVFETSSAEQQARQREFPERYPRLLGEWIEENGVADGAKVEAINNLEVPADMVGSVDRVLVFRFMHNLYRRGVLAEEMANFHNLLKDDGLLGIVQHRARADAPDSYADGNNGYMREADVIKLVEAHGFELVASSEINANPKDSADHVGGVWQIPPSWSSRDEAKKAIGESDRMTLLFKKSK